MKRHDMRAAVRVYTPQDLSAVLQLWDAAGCVPRGPDGLSVDEAVELIGSEHAVTVVAEADGRLVGMVLGTATAPTAWIHRVAVAEVDPAEVADRPSGVPGGRVQRTRCPPRSKRCARGRRTARLARAPRLRGRPRARACPARLSPSARAPQAITRLGGRIIGPGLWDELRGLEEAKELIERRVILPLAEPRLAERHAVAPPKAIVLFGPPGTGKTTFAKGIASRLGLAVRGTRTRAARRTGRRAAKPGPWSMRSIRCSNSRRWWPSSTRSRTSPRCARKTAA